MLVKKRIIIIIILLFLIFGLIIIFFLVGFLSNRRPNDNPINNNKVFNDIFNKHIITNINADHDSSRYKFWNGEAPSTDYTSFKQLDGPVLNYYFTNTGYGPIENISLYTADSYSDKVFSNVRYNNVDETFSGNYYLIYCYGNSLKNNDNSGVPIFAILDENGTMKNKINGNFNKTFNLIKLCTNNDISPISPNYNFTAGNDPKTDLWKTDPNVPPVNDYSKLITDFNHKIGNQKIIIYTNPKTKNTLDIKINDLTNNDISFQILKYTIFLKFINFQPNPDFPAKSFITFSGISITTSSELDKAFEDEVTANDFSFK